MLEKYYVYIFLNGTYQRCALLSYDGSVYRLAYGVQYLQREDAVPIDPLNLPLYEKTFESESVFGALKDSSPDRWGRYLLEKRFNRSLTEIEYILANGLDHVGALAFSPVEYEVPVRLIPSGYIPHFTDQISLELIINQTEIALKNEEDKEKLRELLNYGPSLGGARPKYSIVSKGKSYLAKYSISQDTRREPLLEFATMRLAKEIGLNVPEIKIGKASDRDVFYIERFDRDAGGSKNPFVSALSLCAWDEGDYQVWSYLIFVESLIKIGKSEDVIKQDLAELFKRIAFNIAVNNDDDHPRNHGVLYKDKQWRLSPLYDVVPKDSQTQSFRLAMELGLKKKEASKSNLLSVHSYFKLSEVEANKIIDGVFDFVGKNWEKFFSEAGLRQDEIIRFKNAMSYKA
jgi:serine/threonine-protein kinase HipA